MRDMHPFYSQNPKLFDRVFIISFHDSEIHHISRYIVEMEIMFTLDILHKNRPVTLEINNNRTKLMLRKFDLSEPFNPFSRETILDFDGESIVPRFLKPKRRLIPPSRVNPTATLVAFLPIVKSYFHINLPSRKRTPAVLTSPYA